MPPEAPSDPHDSLRAEALLALLRLTLTKGLGPVLIRRACEAFGGPVGALNASPARWQSLDGVGENKARAIPVEIDRTLDKARKELDRCASMGVRLLAQGSPDYPRLLTDLHDAPPLLYVAGSLDQTCDSASVGIVGSRACTHYGMEQALRFARAFAQAGLTVVSGGARGIDTAAHRSAMDAGGRTIVVLGCGIDHTYPPENLDLFRRVVTGGGVVLSELPLGTAPAAENFPARNRIIAGLSLGVLVIEAARGSGALITAKDAVEKYGRESFALPGRVDSPASMGALELIRSGGAQLVIDPGDCIKALEGPARRTRRTPLDAERAALLSALFEQTTEIPKGLDPEHKPSQMSAQGIEGVILEALHEPQTFDQLLARTGLEASHARVALTMLELSKRIRRSGSRLEKY